MLHGKRHYLGRYDAPESCETYHRLIAEWLDGDCRTPPPADAVLTINELIAAFWQHAQSYYLTPDGTPTSELDNF